MKTTDVKKMILEKMPNAQVRVSDMTGTQDHFDIEVVSPEFKGKSIIEQHKMIFAILGDEMDKGIHAVQLKTKVSN